ncbi:MAG: hypothetical protein ACXVIJ_03985 [Thermoanaerobaculia bacterium]
MERTERQIMTTAKRCLLASAFALTIALPSHAYNDVVTHPQLTIIATEKSVLYEDGSIMFNLGLLPADKQFFLYGARANNLRYGTQIYPLSAFVGEGSFDEDIGTRAKNHFYDPVFERSLTVFGIGIGNRSWRWMLEDLGDIDEQNNSYPDARNFLIRALTFNEGAPADSANERGIAMAQMFLSLGHLQHHMQDMTQPQHVRNDQHYDGSPFLVGIYNPSRYERYTAERGPFVQSYAEMAAPIFPGSSSFKVPRDFWSNITGNGVAQFTNFNFVSQGTNFTMYHGQVNTGTYSIPTPGPSTDYTVGALFADSGISVPADIQNLCGLGGVDCTMTMYSTLTSQKASTLSIFDQDLRAKGLVVNYAGGDIPGAQLYSTERLFDLNRFNMDDAHTVLMGRAVAYSAGIVNYFFRGKLMITAPAQGPYAVVDHSTNTGFTTVKLTVTNDTPNEALSSGTIQAIALFHRNFCYQPDLSGEFTSDSSGNLVPPCPNYRSEESYIRLTSQDSTSFGVGESKEMTFTFSDPIPLDATDLIIQVLYRGTVGAEDSSFALGAIDVSEPTYFTVMNATDVFELSANGFYYYNDIIQGIANSPFSVIDADHNQSYNSPPDVNVVGGPIAFAISIDGKKVGDVTLPEGRFARLAALVSPFGFEVVLTAIGNGFFTTDGYDFGAKKLQYDPQQNAVIVSPVSKLRKQSLQFDSVSYYHFYPTTGTPLDKMQESKAANATQLVTVTMTP